MGRLTRIIAFATAATVAIGVTVAAAASLPIASQQLYSVSLSVTPVVPTVYTWASFNEADGNVVTGHALNGGGTWVVVAGSWRILGNVVKARFSGADASIVVNVGARDVAVTATLLVQTGGTRQAGIVINDNGAGSRLRVIYSNVNGGQITLSKSISGTETTLGTITGIGTPAAPVLRVSSVGNVITASFNGVAVLTSTLSAADTLVFKAAGANRHGVILDSDNNSALDDFRVETP